MYSVHVWSNNINNNDTSQSSVCRWLHSISESSPYGVDCQSSHTVITVCWKRLHDVDVYSILKSQTFLKYFYIRLFGTGTSMSGWSAHPYPVDRPIYIRLFSVSRGRFIPTKLVLVGFTTSAFGSFTAVVGPPVPLITDVCRFRQAAPPVSGQDICSEAIVRTLDRADSSFKCGGRWRFELASLVLLNRAYVTYRLLCLHRRIMMALVIAVTASMMTTSRTTPAALLEPNVVRGRGSIPYWVKVRLVLMLLWDSWWRWLCRVWSCWVVETWSKTV